MQSTPPTSLSENISVHVVRVYFKLALFDCERNPEIAGIYSSHKLTPNNRLSILLGARVTEVFSPSKYILPRINAHALFYPSSTWLPE